MLARQMYNKTLYYTMRNCTNVSPNDTKNPYLLLLRLFVSLYQAENEAQ